MYFGNKTISLHVVRGILGFAALYSSLSMMGSITWLSLILLPAAVYFFKGCPLCWTLGLVETIAMKIHKYNEDDLLEASSRTWQEAQNAR